MKLAENNFKTNLSVIISDNFKTNLSVIFWEFGSRIILLLRKKYGKKLRTSCKTLISRKTF